jgi:hypothetical protein
MRKDHQLQDRGSNCLEAQDIGGQVPTAGQALVFQNGQWEPGVPSAAGGAGVGLEVIYRPGGVAMDNVYTTWPTAYAAAAAQQGPVTIGVDDSIVSPAPVAAGTWDMQGRIYLDSAGPAGDSFLSVPAGAQLLNSPGGQHLTVLCSATLALPSFFWDGTATVGGAPAGARTFDALDGFTVENNALSPATGPLCVVGTAAAPVSLQVNADNAQFLTFPTGGVAKIFSIPAGSSVFGTWQATTFSPRNMLLTGAGQFAPFIAPGGDTPAVDGTFTGTLILFALPGPVRENVNAIVDGGAGVVYNIDQAYVQGATNADDTALWCSPHANSQIQLNLPDARLPMNVGRVIVIVDANGQSEGSPMLLHASAPNPLNGVVGGTTPLSGARAQWVVRGDGAQWDVVQMPRADGPNFLTQTVWFVDPQKSLATSSDSNDGLTAATAIVTNAELARRLGGTQPDFGSPAFVTVVTFLSDMNASDPWEFTPRQGTMDPIGTFVQVQLGSFATFAARVQGTNAGGSSQATGTTVSFASWLPFVGMFLQDTTIGNCWMGIDTDTTAGTAIFTQPITDPRSNSTMPVPTMLFTPAAGNNFTIWRPTIMYTGTTGAITANAQVIVQNMNIQPIVAGGQLDFFGSIGLQLCNIAASCTMAAQIQANNGSTANVGQPIAAGCMFAKGGDMHDYAIYSCGITAPYVMRAAGTQAFVGGGSVFKGAAAPQSLSSPGKHQIGDVGFFSPNLNLLGAGANRQGNGGVISLGTDTQPGAVPAAWGTSFWHLKSLGWCMCSPTGSFAAQLLVSGGIQLAGLNTASGYNPSNGAFVPAIATFTPQNGGAGVSVQLGVGAGIGANIDGTGAGSVPNNTGAYAPGNNCGFCKEA